MDWNNWLIAIGCYWIQSKGAEAISVRYYYNWGQLSWDLEKKRSDDMHQHIEGDVGMKKSEIVFKIKKLVNKMRKC